MSFILDALRKLEEKRAPETTRELLAGGIPAPRNKPRGKALWPFIVTAVLVFNLLAATGWYALRQLSGGGKDAPLPVLSSEIATEGEKTSLPELSHDGGGEPERRGTVAVLSDHRLTEAPDTSRLPVAAEDHPPQEPVVQGPEEEDLQSSPAAGEDSPPPSEGIDGPEEEGRAATGAVDGLHPTGEPAADAPLLPLAELPGEIRDSLKDLDIDGHVYSDDPGFRLLSIDGGLKREGDLVRPGLRVETISPEGAVFTYRGYRFSMKGY